MFIFFFLQINAWGKAHECFCGAWGFFHKDDDDAVVVIFNVLSCSITGARGSQVQIFWFVVCLFCVSLYGFTLCLSVVAVSSRLFLVCFYTDLFFFLPRVVLSVVRSTCLAPLVDRPLTEAFI